MPATAKKTRKPPKSVRLRALFSLPEHGIPAGAYIHLEPGSAHPTVVVVSLNPERDLSHLVNDPRCEILSAPEAA